jgi:hypothetical protein
MYMLKPVNLACWEQQGYWAGIENTLDKGFTTKAANISKNKCFQLEE